MGGSYKENKQSEMNNKQENDESICGTCEKEVSSHNGLQCDLWDQCFHCGCEKVSAADYKLLSREDNGAQWYCYYCRTVRGLPPLPTMLPVLC